MKLKILLTTVIAIVLGLAIAGLRHVDQLNDGIELKKIELQDNSSKLKILNKEYEDLNKQLEDKDADTKKIEQERQKLEKEKQELEKALQAKLDKKRRDIAAKAESAARQAVQPSRAYASTGNSSSLLAQAGISDPYHANLIVNKESTWRTSVTNAGGCIGLIQACPGGLKPLMLQACPNWANDPVCQLRVAEGYMKGRYSSWAAAWQFHIKNNYW